MSYRRFALPLAVAGLAVVAAGCGGSDDDGSAIPEVTSAPAKASATTSPDGATVAPGATTAAAPSDVLDELITQAAGFEEVAIWGGTANGVTFAAPNGLAVDADGSVYVIEYQGGHLRKFASDGTLLFEVAGNGADPGKLGSPIGVTIASDGSIFVSEYGNSRITAFNADGSFRANFSGPGTDPGQLSSARGIAASDEGELFVADSGNQRVQVFTTDGDFVRTWGEFGTGPGQFNGPNGLQIGPAGDVWVVDGGNERVQVFNQHGELLRSYDEVGADPQVISLNSEGEFFVSSPWADGRVRHFSPDGELLGTVGLSATSEELRLMSPDDRATIEAMSTLRGPHGTATDATGAVYLADSANGIVRKFIPVDR